MSTIVERIGEGFEDGERVFPLSFDALTFANVVDVVVLGVGSVSAAFGGLHACVNARFYGAR